MTPDQRSPTADLPFESDRQPLAARLRPRTLEEFHGQDHIIGHGRLLRRAIEADQLSSLILSGPPGTGKTTLARVIAARTQSQFLTINAVLSGVKDIRSGIDAARSYRAATNRRTILFVDEVHRWNRSQQDALLPWVEDGLFVLIGATTENPFFEVNRALLSRSRVFLLQPLSSRDLDRILDYALTDRERGYGELAIEITPEARKHLIATSGGDARTLLNAVELAVETSSDVFPPRNGEPIRIDLAVAEDSIQKRAVLYDKDGDYHFDTISAFIKSIRGSDPDAALYWLSRMIAAGEDPHYIFRRLLIQASEDVGLADPQALQVVLSCAQAFDRIGLPEGRFHLTQATLYLALAEKSNSTLALFDALSALEEEGRGEVPGHLKDASRDGAHLGHGVGYLYPHAYTNHWVAQQYLPQELQGRVYYHGGKLGWEGSRNETVRERRLLQLSATEENKRQIWSVLPGGPSPAVWEQRAESADTTEYGELRDLFLEGMAIQPTDRVLLFGDGISIFLWPMMRTVPAGLTAVWSTPPVLEVLRHSLGPRADRVDAPQFRPIQGETQAGDGETHTPPDATLHDGPFEFCIYRQNGIASPETASSRLLPLLAPGGTLRIIDIDPHSGDRPSTVLPLPDKLRSLLAAIEDEIYPPRAQRWEHALAASVRRVSVQQPRRVTPEIALSWFDPQTELGATVENRCAEAELRALRTVAASFPATEISWNRSYLIVTTSSLHAGKSP